MDRHYYAEVVEYVIERSTGEPLAKRAKLYRGLAALCGDEINAPALNKLAAELESADKRCREFAFQFSQRKDGQ